MTLALHWSGSTCTSTDGEAENGHLSASLDFVTSAPRQSALSRERQRLSVSTLILWPTSETG